MTDSEKFHGTQDNRIDGPGIIITGGHVADSQLVTTSVSGPPNPLVQQLQAELARARACLAGVQDRTDDDEDALEAIDRLHSEVAQHPDPDQRGLRRLRLRVRELIGVLTPVAGIIGGVAAFEEICRHL